MFNDRPSCTHLGGVVLWSRSFTPAAAHIASSSASPVNSLIREALIEGRNADDKYEKDGYAVKWTFFNDLELIFVVCRPAHPRGSRTTPYNEALIIGGMAAYSPADLRRRPPRGSENSVHQALRALPGDIRGFFACSKLGQRHLSDSHSGDMELC